ncbi:MAG: hypothetical protein ACE14L_00315 [Terriglobales bacterium]
MYRASCLGLVLLLALCGCGDGNSSLNPRFQPQVNNAQDNFQFQSTGVTNVTETLTYTWQNTGVLANVDQATTVTAGSARLTLRDSLGTRVYDAGLERNGSLQSDPPGQPGAWTIVVTLQGYSGTINFRVQKRP